MSDIILPDFSSAATCNKAKKDDGLLGERLNLHYHTPDSTSNDRSQHNKVEGITFRVSLIGQRICEE